jgi:hypothetical protein
MSDNYINIYVIDYKLLLLLLLLLLLFHVRFELSLN